MKCGIIGGMIGAICNFLVFPIQHIYASFRYSMIWPDHPTCTFVFDVWNSLSSMTRGMHGAFQTPVAS